ncbi:MAG: 50S ribosomal protein L11 methyltransferase [Campylobacteraceae bacterium]
MQDKYYELEVTPNSHHEDFSDFILTLFPEAIEEVNDSIIVRSEEPLDILQWGVEEFAKKLSSTLGEEIEVKTKLCQKENVDWIAKYQNSVEPIEVGNLYIHPSWLPKKDGLTNIVIDPALAFGSGHHASTYGCLLMLQRYTNLGYGVLDVGTGSGILAIAASKLGAICDICDTDEQALLSAKENFALNDVKFRRVWTGSVQNRDGAKYDLVVANIIADVLLMIKSDLVSAMKENATLILSGILDKYVDRVKEKYNLLFLYDEYKQDEWHTLVYKG